MNGKKCVAIFYCLIFMLNLYAFNSFLVFAETDSPSANNENHAPKTVETTENEKPVKVQPRESLEKNSTAKEDKSANHKTQNKNTDAEGLEPSSQVNSQNEVVSPKPEEDAQTKNNNKALKPVEKKSAENEKKEDKSENDSLKNKITLPEIADIKLSEDNIHSESSNNYNSEKMIKGVIAWIMIFAGILLIVYVILKNRKIPKMAKKPKCKKCFKVNKKHRLYYKSLHRK